MSHTIQGFQADRAVDLIERIAQETGNEVSTLRVHSLMVKHGVVSERTYWAKVENVLNDLGYDYDEIFEVLER